MKRAQSSDAASELDVLSSHWSGDVRKAVALNQHTSPTTLAKLCEDSLRKVAIPSATHPQTPHSARHQAFKGHVFASVHSWLWYSTWGMWSLASLPFFVVGVPVFGWTFLATGVLLLLAPTVVSVINKWDTRRVFRNDPCLT